MLGVGDGFTVMSTGSSDSTATTCEGDGIVCSAGGSRCTAYSNDITCPDAIYASRQTGKCSACGTGGAISDICYCIVDADCLVVGSGSGSQGDGVGCCHGDSSGSSDSTATTCEGDGIVCSAGGSRCTAYSNDITCPDAIYASRQTGKCSACGTGGAISDICYCIVDADCLVVGSGSGSQGDGVGCCHGDSSGSSDSTATTCEGDGIVCSAGGSRCTAYSNDITCPDAIYASRQTGKCSACGTGGAISDICYCIVDADCLVVGSGSGSQGDGVGCCHGDSSGSSDSTATTCEGDGIVCSAGGSWCTAYSNDITCPDAIYASRQTGKCSACGTGGAISDICYCIVDADCLVLVPAAEVRVMVLAAVTVIVPVAVTVPQPPVRVTV